MKRTAIVLEKNLNPWQKANVSVILMGQMALLADNLFDKQKILDKDENLHSAIMYSTVLLEANSVTQIVNLVTNLKNEFKNLQYVLFSRKWQSLNNEFETYRQIVSNSSLEELEPVWIAVFGEDEEVRLATKKFSLLK